MVKWHSWPRGIILPLPSTRQGCVRGDHGNQSERFMCAIHWEKKKGTVKCQRKVAAISLYYWLSNTIKQFESIIITIAPIATFPASARPDSDADHLFKREKIIQRLRSREHLGLIVRHLSTATKGSLFLVSATLVNCVARFSQICPHLRILLLCRIICIVCGREGLSVEFKVRLMS